jgi:hypothetical protein
MPDTYTFSGDAVTFLGLVGILSTFVIVVTAYRRFYLSPLNVRVPVTKLAQEPTTDTPDGVFYTSPEETNP